MPLRRFAGLDWLLLLVVLLAAGGARAWYVRTCAADGSADGPIRVQDSPRSVAEPGGGPENGAPAARNELTALAQSIRDQHSFAARAPLSSRQETTAYRAPGYPWLLAAVQRSPANLGGADRAARWIQAALGTLTAVLYFL